MGERRTPDARDGRADPPRWVEVTLLPDPDAHPLSQRLKETPAAVRLAAATVIALAVAVSVFVGAGALAGTSHRAAGSIAARPADALNGSDATGDDAPWAAAHAALASARNPGATGVAAAYGYPARCLSVTFAPADRAYARADYNHGSPCGRFDGNVTAIFHRVDSGSWRPVLIATIYSCPVARLSNVVQTELGVCE